MLAVAAPGHTADHVSIVVQDDATTFFLAGDTSYRGMLAGRVDGVSPDERISRATLDAIKGFARGPSDGISADARSPIRRSPCKSSLGWGRWIERRLTPIVQAIDETSVPWPIASFRTYGLNDRFRGTADGRSSES